MNKETYVSMDEEFGEAWSDDGIACPHCGYCHVNDLQEIQGAYEEGYRTMECWNCDTEFGFDPCITISYTSYKGGKDE
jgi:hypothetical protein